MSWRDNYQRLGTVEFRFDPVSGAIIASAVIGAGASAYTSDKQKKSSKKISEANRAAQAKQFEQQQAIAEKNRAAQGRLRQENIERQKASKASQQGRVAQVENLQLRSKGIQGLGSSFRSQQANVLDEGAQNATA